MNATVISFLMVSPIFLSLSLHLDSMVLAWGCCVTRIPPPCTYNGTWPSGATTTCVVSLPSTAQPCHRGTVCWLLLHVKCKDECYGCSDTLDSPATKALSVSLYIICCICINTCSGYSQCSNHTRWQVGSTHSWPLCPGKIKIRL